MKHLRSVTAQGLIAAGLAIVLTGCATRGSNYVPLVDQKTIDPAALQTDIKECQAYAAQRYDEQQAAVVGALFGAAIGAAASNKYSGNLTAVGAAAGAGGALRGTLDSQERIIARCMMGRGYNVLD